MQVDSQAKEMSIVGLLQTRIFQWDAIKINLEIICWFTTYRGNDLLEINVSIFRRKSRWCEYCPRLLVLRDKYMWLVSLSFLSRLDVFRNICCWTQIPLHKIQKVNPFYVLVAIKYLYQLNFGTWTRKPVWNSRTWNLNETLVINSRRQNASGVFDLWSLLVE